MISLFPKQPKPILLISGKIKTKQFYQWIKSQIAWRSIRKEYHVLYIENKKLKIPKLEILSIKTREIEGAELIMPMMEIIGDVMKRLPKSKQND